MGYEVKKEFIDTILNRDIKYIQKKRKQLREKTVDNFIEPTLVSKIRESIQNDYARLEKMFGSELERFEKEEIEELLTVLIAERGEENVFYRDYKEKKVNTNRSINSQIEKGKLEYQYEENYNSIITLYNQLYNKKIPEDVEDVVLEKTFEIQIMLVEFVEEIFYGRVEEAKKSWRVIKIELEKWCNVIRNICINDVKHNLLGAWVGIGLMEGYIRDVLLNIIRAYGIEEVVESYVKEINERVLKKDEEDMMNQYHLLQSYALFQYSYAIQGEKKIWITIRKFLLETSNSHYDDVKENTKSAQIKYKRHKKDVDTIYEWLMSSGTRLPIGDRDEAIVLKAIYKECFLIKEIIPQINRRGIRSFLNQLNDSSKKDYSNLTDTEMFYYEKIFRGIYRERGKVGQYIQETECLLKLYKAELNMIQHKYMKGNYLKNWADIIKASFCKAVDEHLIKRIV